ncbi:MAG: glycosyltransferase [Lachnospiraceae bacterium]|nr:glycosyltransferase [Lachnospiraceae bacterium]
MKITAIGVIKNAADVIETCIRGNSWLIDQFVFLDNMSTDRTVEILQALQAEGFQIEVISDTEIQHLQAKKMDKLCAYVYEKYPSDFIIPIDDDEIIIPENKNISISDAREALCSLNRDSLYYASWRVYIPTEADDNTEVNVAKRQTYCFANNVSTHSKVIIPSELTQEDGFHLLDGNHGAIFTREHGNFLFPYLKFAHFPIRSAEQIKSKALIGWTNLLSIPDRCKVNGIHWGTIYEQVKEGNPLTVDMLQTLSALYLLPDAEIEVVRYPVSLPSEYLQLKYTRSNEVNALENYCYYVESLAAKYGELVKQLKDE